MLPVDAEGHPQRGIGVYGPNQICYSNLEFREFTKKEVQRCIAEREKFAEYGNAVLFDRTRQERGIIGSQILKILT